MSLADTERRALARRTEPGAMLIAWLPVVLWMGVIFWLSGDQFSDERTASWLAGSPLLSVLGLPPAVIDVVNLIVRKCAHFVEYALLSMLAYRAMCRSFAAPARRALAVAIVLAVSVASIDEMHQATTATRSGSPKDVVLDSAGALAGALTGATYLYRRARRRDRG